MVIHCTSTKLLRSLEVTPHCDYKPPNLFKNFVPTHSVTTLALPAFHISTVRVFVH